VKIGKARLDDLQPGEGAVQVVPKAFGNATATLVAVSMPPAPTPPRCISPRRVAVRVGQRARIDLAWRRRAATQSFSAGAHCRRAGEPGRHRARRGGAEVKDKTLESMDVKLFVEQADRRSTPTSPRSCSARASGCR
jgi:hypothetical protein